jgi:hypothetical protein
MSQQGDHGRQLFPEPVVDIKGKYLAKTLPKKG